MPDGRRDDSEGERPPDSSELSIPRRVKNGQAIDDSDDTVTETESRVAVELGALCVEIQGDSLAEAETAFYRVWAHIMADMDEMTDAMRERLGGYQ